MKKFSISRIAKISGYSKSFICKLVKNGSVKGGTKDGAFWSVNSDRDTIIKEIQAVAKVAPYKKKGSNHKVVTTNVQHSGLASLLELASIPREKRELVKALAERYTVEELTLLIQI